MCCFLLISFLVVRVCGLIICSFFFLFTTLMECCEGSVYTLYFKKLEGAMFLYSCSYKLLLGYRGLSHIMWRCCSFIYEREGFAIRFIREMLLTMLHVMLEFILWHLLKSYVVLLYSVIFEYMLHFRWGSFSFFFLWLYFFCLLLDWKYIFVSVILQN